MSRMILMMGASGSGKSSLANKISCDYAETSGWNPNIYSNDDFFMIYDPSKRKEIYQWKAEFHEYAQRYCLSRVAKACVDGQDLVIVDNTHTNMAAIQPYLHLAQKVGYPVEIVEPNTFWRYSANDCFKRNVHGVPFDTIKAMIIKILSLKASGLINQYLKVI